MGNAPVKHPETTPSEAELLRDYVNRNSSRIDHRRMAEGLESEIDGTRRDLEHVKGMASEDEAASINGAVAALLAIKSRVKEVKRMPFPDTEVTGLMEMLKEYIDKNEEISIEGAIALLDEIQSQIPGIRQDVVAAINSDSMASVSLAERTMIEMLKEEWFCSEEDLGEIQVFLSKLHAAAERCKGDLLGLK